MRRPGATAARPGNDDGHAGRIVEEAGLVPHAVLAGHLAVVGQVDGERVVGQPILVERLHDATDVRVAEVHHAVVGGARPGDIVVGNAIEQAHEPPQPLVERMQSVQVTRRYLGQVGVLREVPAEVRLPNGERQVRHQISDGQRPGPLVALRLRQILRRGHRDRLVVSLIVGVAGTRRLDERNARRELVAAALGVRRPRDQRLPSPDLMIADELAREPVVHIGSDEVHPTRHGGLVPEGVEPVRPGRLAGRQFGGVVPDADAARVASGHERGARRHAERKVAVGVLEHRPAVGEPLHGGRLDGRVAVRRAHPRVVLVGHDDEDVRLRVGGHMRIGSTARVAAQQYAERAHLAGAMAIHAERTDGRCLNAAPDDLR